MKELMYKALYLESQRCNNGNIVATGKRTLHIEQKSVERIENKEEKKLIKKPRARLRD